MPARPRYRPPHRSFFARIPLLVRIAVPLLAVASVWIGQRLWRQSHAILVFTAGVGVERVPKLELTVYPEQLSFAAPSPPQALGTLQIDGDQAVLGGDLVADTAIVRFAGPGIGTGFARAVRGRQTEAIALHRPRSLTGRVGAPEGFFCFGLRPLGLRPIAGARVLGLGGGEHGVVLGETTTDADGRFTLAGFDEQLPGFGIRVLARGYAIGYVDWNGDDEPLIALVPTQPITGVVDLPPDCPREGLQVLAKGLPGVSVSIQPDGRFELDGVPPGLEPRLLIHGLGGNWTHSQQRAKPGDRDVHLRVVGAARLRGRVVDLQTQLPIAGAMVWHDHGPAGMVAVDTDASGRFELDRTPPGSIVVRAQQERQDSLGHRETLVGERAVEVTDGKDLDDVVVRIQ